jgi:pimeloyl-ACP methyl ester carboxylesterase
MLWSHLYVEKLRREFIFVNWDQRGAGYSYRDGLDAGTVSEAQIYEDALALSRYLAKTFKKERIFLLGHSFGSVIGLQLAADHPELFYAYIGAGQVIDYRRSVEITYTWLHATLEKAGDEAGLERIERDRFPYIDLVIKYGGHHAQGIDFDEIVKASPYYSDGYLELLRKGKAFSAENVGRNQSLATVAKTSPSAASIPLYFFEGENDHVIACAPELVVEFCEKASAPIKRVVWFRNSAHVMNVEEPEKFQDELIKIKRENAQVP